MTQICNQVKQTQWQKPPNWQQTHQTQTLNAMAIEIVVALVGGGFAVVVALISKVGFDNKKDHGIVHQSLGRIEQKIDGHVQDHR
jgi:hypothetical protein